MFNTDDPIVAKAQKTMLEILLEVTCICEKENISYWLEAGTLLGAVRHKGFIPWDDDMDIGMTRSDYNRFLAIAPKYLDKKYFLQTKETDPAYPLHFAKVRRNDTLLIETGETGKEPYHHGIFIDIFPFDYYSSKTFIDLMCWSSVFRDKKKKYHKGSVKRLLITFYTNIIMGLPVWIIGQFRKYCEKHHNIFRGDHAKYFTYALECCPGKGTLTEDIVPVNYAPDIFEGYGFYIPANPEKVLSLWYGKNYMELPPVEQRKTHAKTIYFKF